MAGLLALSPARADSPAQTGSQTVLIQSQPQKVQVGTSGEVRFTNSVTGQPVRITFEVGVEQFTHFAMWTDMDTEGYYTSGEYRINDRLKGEAARTLNYCSQVGMELRLGEQLWKIKDNCLTLTIP